MYVVLWWLISIDLDRCLVRNMWHHHYSNTWWPSSPTHIYAPRLWKFNSLRHFIANDRIPEWSKYASLKWPIIGLYNGLSPIRRQTIVETNDNVSSITSEGTIFNRKIVETSQDLLKKNVREITVCNFGAMLSAGTSPFVIWCHVMRGSITACNLVPCYPLEHHHL